MKQLTDLHTALLPELTKFEEHRLKAQKKLNNYTIASLTTLGIGLLLFLVITYYWEWSIAFFLVLALFFIPIFGIINKLQRKTETNYVQAFKNKAILNIVDTLLPEMKYLPNKYIDEHVFRQSGLLKLPSLDYYNGEDWFAGQIGETGLMMSKICAAVKYDNQYYSENIDGKSYKVLFKGIFMVADFHKHFKGQTFLYTGKPKANKHLQKVVMENVEFEKQFTVYSTDEVEARYLLSPNMQERIIALKRKFHQPIHLSFIDSCLCILIEKASIIDVDVKDSLLKVTTFQKYYDKMQFLFSIIEDLNLNTRIWSKQTF